MLKSAKILDQDVNLDQDKSEIQNVPSIQLYKFNLFKDLQNLQQSFIFSVSAHHFSLTSTFSTETSKIISRKVALNLASIGNSSVCYHTWDISPSIYYENMEVY